MEATPVAPSATPAIFVPAGETHAGHNGRMAILIDPPRWPAWGTIFSHLVSDSSLEELHEFAAANGVPLAAFDHDHYDVPERMYAALVAAGAEAVRETELIRRLIKGGMRVRATERTPKRKAATTRARDAWPKLLPGAPQVGADLIERWSEPHRHYHDVRHLVGTLDALARLGCDDRSVLLAAWFHDAVYDGAPGQDEEASAQLAREQLTPLLTADEVAEVERLVRLTITHDPADGDERGALLSDADLAVLGANAGRYDVYARDVRLDFDHLDDATFRAGRIEVLEGLLRAKRLFHTELGHDLWEDAARANLERELASLHRHSA